MMREGRPPSLCDPALLPSIVPRIQTIARLLLQARDTPLERDDKEDPHSHSERADASVIDTTPTSLALGTITNDDDDDDESGPWSRMASTGITMRRIPTSILAQIAQETAQLRSTFAAAHEAVDAAPGADMSIEDQHTLLANLEAYAQRQRDMQATWQQSLSDIME